MRIIAGEKRSRRLAAPEGTDTRPTADRVREALFSILGRRVSGARVLDLYAGSGALALESLSRGAAAAVLVDCGAKACRVIRENIDALAYGDRAQLLRMTDTAALAKLSAAGEQFDLVFLDPPYRMDTAPVCERLAREGLLAAGGLIVTEHAKETPPAVSGALALTDRRIYGVTGLSLFARAGEENT